MEVFIFLMPIPLAALMCKYTQLIGNRLLGVLGLGSMVVVSVVLVVSCMH
jgi:hypothetical protein